MSKAQDLAVDWNKDITDDILININDIFIIKI